MAIDSRFNSTSGKYGYSHIGDNLPLPQIDEKLIIETVVNGGVVTELDPADIPNSALSDATNCVVRFDRTERRPGSSAFGPAKPNSDPIMKLAFVKIPDGTGYTVRHTPTTIHKLVANVWTNITDSNTPGNELAGTSTDHLNSVVVLDTYAMSNNGANPIQKIDLAGGTFANCGNAPAYRYITGFFNRIVGAALRGTNEVQIGWSGDANPTEWDQNVDDTAGSSPLIDSPSDLADFITGLFGWTNVMAVLREKSVWLANKQPIAQNPFYFYASVPGIGCDSPYSAVNVGDGIAWLDRRTEEIYIYVPGQVPQPIGGPNRGRIFGAIKDPTLIFGAYDPIEHEYTVAIPRIGTKLVDTWTFNRRNNSWVSGQFYDLTTLADVEVGGGGGLTIDQLVGTIDALTGTINSLSPDIGIYVSERLRGHGDGSITITDPLQPIDAAHTDYPTGYAFESILSSKVFMQPSHDSYFTRTIIEYISKIAADIILETSIDNGRTWQTRRTFSPTVLDKPRLLKLNKVIRSRRYQWRLRTSGGLFSVLSYWIHASVGGQSNK
jgi:hypothetical protein